jgi:GAF domain-containing protein
LGVLEQGGGEIMPIQADARLAEQQRLSVLRDYAVLDTEDEPEFDALVRRAARATATPIALISLVDERRQWFKARFGIDLRETPLTMSFCTHAIRGEGVFVVEDASRHHEFRGYACVTGAPHVRFYAGAPLKAPNGSRIGTLCVIDTVARPAPPGSFTRLIERLAAETISSFEQRKARRRAAASLRAQPSAA